jgi:hypothetical protein
MLGSQYSTLGLIILQLINSVPGLAIRVYFQTLVDEEAIIRWILWASFFHGSMFVF